MEHDKDMEVPDSECSRDSGQSPAVNRFQHKEIGLTDLNGNEPENWICVWPDGTRCWLADLEEFLVFMDDDYKVVGIHDYDLQPLGLM